MARREVKAAQRSPPMFRFSIRKAALGIVVVAAMYGTLFCCWTLRPNPEKQILAGPGRAENAEPLSVYKSEAKRLSADHVVEDVGPERGPGVGGPGPGVLPPVLPPMMIPVSMPSVQVLFTKPEGMQVCWGVRQA